MYYFLLFLGIVSSHVFASTEVDSPFKEIETYSVSYGRVISSDQLSTLFEHEADLIDQLAIEQNQGQQVILYYMLAEVRRDMATQLRLKNHAQYAVYRSVESSSLAPTILEKKTIYRQLASEWTTSSSHATLAGISDDSSNQNSEDITFFMIKLLSYFTLGLVIFLVCFSIPQKQFRPFFERK
jgi:hypothetical protein